MAEISYEQHENVPFPFITDFRNLDIQFRSMEEVMARESKLWLYAEESCFDEKGRLLSYNDPDRRLRNAEIRINTGFFFVTK